MNEKAFTNIRIFLYICVLNLKDMKINQADKWFSIFIRLRDSDEMGYCKCVTCGNIRHWKNLDCGHWIKRQHVGTRYNEKNCAAQCKGCNAFEQGRSIEHEQFIIKTYGIDTRNLLKSGERSYCKYSKLELHYLANEYKSKAMEMAKIKGIEI